MRLYNTLGRQLEDFKPINPPKVKLYTCGPTVYDYAHIGNLRAFVFDDTLRRALEALDYKVHHIMNVTDVGHLTSDADEGEDKLEKGAKREGKTVWQVAELYTNAFLEDVKELNILPPSQYAKATEFIQAQLDLVEKLIKNGYAYQTEQAVYFEVSKLSDYGKLTGQALADKEVGVRAEVHTDPNKHHPQDFALWFFTIGRYEGHEMHWPSPWGDGFPGWHLECSAIIHSLLGEPIDIHTGGVDHIGTHHTNEIAQTEAAYGLELAKFWMHNEHLLVDGKRMAKSAGNFYTLADIKKRGFDPLALRLLFLQSHYRSQMNFTLPALDAAQAFLLQLQGWADSAHQSIRSTIDDTNTKILIGKIKASLELDLNTAAGLAALNEYIDGIAPSIKLLEFLDEVFGLILSSRPDISEEQKAIVAQREEARSSNDWTKADKLRAKLKSQSLEIEDTAGGPLWRRV